MLKAATWVREDLKTHPRVAELLSFVVGANPIGGTILKDGMIDGSQNISTPLAQTVAVKRLIIVGHSLGAGTAVVLGMLMKGEYPHLHVYGYGSVTHSLPLFTTHSPSPIAPLGVSWMKEQQLVLSRLLDCLTSTVSFFVEVGSYVTSCILADDVVGSLSFHSLHRIREEVWRNSLFRLCLICLSLCVCLSVSLSLSLCLSHSKVLESISRSRVSKMQIMQTTMFLVRARLTPFPRLTHCLHRM
jgi:hypothetical protein